MLKKTVFTACLISLSCASSLALAKNPKPVKVSPFTDNITVNLKGFSSADSINLKCKNNNDVNISCPSSVNAAQGGYRFQIASSNIEEDGYPSMTIIEKSKNINCGLVFVDGPWTYLDYKSQIPPQCAHLTVSDVSYDSDYTYHIDVTYQQ